MNRLDALKYFVVAADTLNFRHTAQHFSVSPQVISRMIGELENELGASLFRRNTRSIRLTDFGLDFLPRAEKFLRDEQQLFGAGKLQDHALSGTVRVTLPLMVDSEKILHKLLLALEPYPHIALDWRSSFDLMKTVEDSIDIGVRICQVPEEHWVAKKLHAIDEIIVAAPALLEKTGMPQNITDLVENYPLGTLLNTQTGRGWDWNIDDKAVPLTRPHFLAAEPSSLLLATLAGRIFAPFERRECAEYIARGELLEIFPCNLSKWTYYLYRPYQTITPKRVLLVFDLLANILQEHKNP